MQDRQADLDERERRLEAEVAEEEQRSRRLQIVVYPSLVAFIILAGYGFFLITSLTRDMSRMADEVAKMAATVDRDMSLIATKMVNMDRHMTSMDLHMTNMDGHMGTMNSNIGTITGNTGQMALATTNMQRDMWSMNQNVSAPFSMMNQALPWSTNQGGFPGSPGPLPFGPYPQP